MDFRGDRKIGKSWPVVTGKLWRDVAVATGAKIDA
jgi:hypothetical protein